MHGACSSHLSRHVRRRAEACTANLPIFTECSLQASQGTAEADDVHIAVGDDGAPAAVRRRHALDLFYWDHAQGLHRSEPVYKHDITGLTMNLNVAATVGVKLSRDKATPALNLAASIQIYDGAMSRTSHSGSEGWRSCK